MGAVVERLVDQLRAAGLDVPDGWTFHRTRSGRHQRSVGAWSWFLLAPDGRELCGSQYSVGRLVGSGFTVTRRGLDVELDPTEGNEP